MTRPSVTRSDLNPSLSGQGSINTSDPNQTQASIEAAKAEADAKAAKVDGSGVGIAGSLSAVLGLHFLALTLPVVPGEGPPGSHPEAAPGFFEHE